MTNHNNKVLYTGVTGNLEARVSAHKNKLVEGFIKKYNVTKLVYFEEFESIFEAIEREKQIKAGSRMKKIELIESINEDWEDLASQV